MTDINNIIFHSKPQLTQGDKGSTPPPLCPLYRQLSVSVLTSILQLSAARHPSTSCVSTPSRKISGRNSPQQPSHAFKVSTCVFL